MGEMANPKGIGGPQKGEVRNPSGLSRAQAEGKRRLMVWLRSPEMEARFQRAYAAALDDGNPAVVVDCANRLMGKVKEEVELSESDERPLKSLAIEKLLALADSLK